MNSEIRNIEPGRPARFGQSILERRFRIVNSIIPSLKDIETMIDIGCGNGAQTAYFLNGKRLIIGYDYVSLKDAEQGKASLDKFPFVRGDAAVLPFRDECIDLVTSFEVLEHLESDTRAVKEIARVLKPGGFLFFSVPNKWWLFESHGANVPGLNWLPWNRLPLVGWLPRPIHERFARARTYTINRAVRLCRNAGFKIFKTGYITAPLDVLPDGIIRRSIRKTAFNGDITSSPFKAVNLFVAAIK